ncbi:MAG: PhoH family protein [Bacteroidales bacterium]|nr:PhoH family protein [Bacteroidales bacterium]MCF8386596.1 PhoH family protein [Bacteroidales bacterium]MCF8398142.1 PhoH family protein [Bacteroidales bacterium]
MSEKTINIEEFNPVEILGVNDVNLNLIKEKFPKLRIIARGNEIKAIGEEKEVNQFHKKMSLLLLMYEKFGRITENDIQQLLSTSDQEEIISSESAGDVLVHGRNGLLVKARTRNQRKMVDYSHQNDLLLAIGPAGTGKTYTAVALAVQALKNKEVKRIILTRPAVEAGESLGFLPGDLKEKLDPYLQPLYDALRDMLPTQKLLTYLEDGTIEIAPLAFMRGRTLDNAFAILDEAQNCTPSQLKMFLTRMGRNSKFIVTGDITQIDLPPRQKSGLVHATEILENIKGIRIVYLDENDIIRHKLVTKIINAYSNKS